MARTSVFGNARESLLAEQAAMQKTLAPFQAARQKLLDAIQPLEDELRKVNAKLKELMPDMASIQNDLAYDARGGKATRSLQAGAKEETGASTIQPMAIVVG